MLVKEGLMLIGKRLHFTLLLIDCLALVMTCHRVSSTYTRAVACAYFARNCQDITLLILKWLLQFNRLFYNMKLSFFLLITLKFIR